MTTPQENEANCREFMQRVFNEHDLSFAEKMISDDFVDRSPMPNADPEREDLGTTSVLLPAVPVLGDGSDLRPRRFPA